MDTNKIPVTVLIPTINSEYHLDALLDTVQPYFEDVVVVDSFSCDSTIDICLRRGVKVLQRPFITSSDQFSWMVTKIPVQTPWVMLIAHDTRVTAELRDEMRKKVKTDSPYVAFNATLRLWFMGHPLHILQTGKLVYRAGTIGITNVTCNEHFYQTVEGKTCNLLGLIEHIDTPTLWHWYEKQNLYSSREAIGIVTGKARTEKPKLFGNKNERNHWFSLMLPRLPFGLGYLLIFLGYYLKYGAWKDGVPGYYWARCRVWVNWVIDFKVKEIRRTGVIPKMPEPRRGTYDPRVMQSELQKQLLPEVVAEWEKSRR